MQDQRSYVNESRQAVRQRQIERPIPGVKGLYLATYPSGRQTYLFRYRDPRTGRKTSLTLGVAAS